ncbi:glycosyltransferase family 1 protein [Salinibacterium sp. G-O1]|uniref:glycosyltransferase family 4 protein n=1 Tax=Salinibacterium sp. G-O1 TaxID=3046208 RepID=UPI0024B99D2E|nr:glycosyltransferase family 1 protein [Salinibacterium sp. G-O1]MDJ0336509.1 glycosyltransferase family 1 protein [Salinibacterium sp. G-O1]
MTVPRTLVDVTAVPSDRRGVGRYIDELIAAFDEPVIVACQAHDAEHYRRLAPTAEVLPQEGIRGVGARLLWEQFRLPAVARRARASVIHSPHYTLPLFTRRARVVTFHDATFFSDPGVHTRFKRVFFRSWIRLAGRLARVIIVPSHATASELDRFTRRRRGLSYVVIHHGVDRKLFHPPTPEAVTAAAVTLGLGSSGWIGFLGTIEPRKNLPQLLKAYQKLVQGWDAAWGDVMPLAIAGGAGWGEAITDDIAAVSEPGRVISLGYVGLDLVPAFLGGATILAYPSLGEGFGLPVLEAMACGSTVLTTRRLALPEVGGDAVAYSEPDAPALAATMARLLSDPVERASLARMGAARAEEFTWTRTASHHLECYRVAGAS